MSYLRYTFLGTLRRPTGSRRRASLVRRQPYVRSAGYTTSQREAQESSTPCEIQGQAVTRVALNQFIRRLVSSRLDADVGATPTCERREPALCLTSLSDELE